MKVSASFGSCGSETPLGVHLTTYRMDSYALSNGRHRVAAHRADGLVAMHVSLRAAYASLRYLQVRPGQRPVSGLSVLLQGIVCCRRRQCSTFALSLERRLVRVFQSVRPMLRKAAVGWVAERVWRLEAGTVGAGQDLSSWLIMLSVIEDHERMVGETLL